MRIGLGLAFAALATFGTASAAEAPKAFSAPVFSGDKTIIGQTIEVPKNPKVVVATVTFPPGSALAVHKHLYPHYVYVLEGTLTVVNAQTGKTLDVPQGKFFAEMTNTWHFGRNNTASTVKLLVIDQLPAGVSRNVVPKSH